MSRGHLTVPCGHCPECISQQQDDWFLRTWKEILDYNSSGGKVVFVTFTYDDAHLPVFTDVAKYTDRLTGEVSLRDFRIPCFDKRHKDKFFNSLLKWFERQGVTGNTSKGVRYMWSSEYGMSDGFTHRPHYHALILLPKEAFVLFRSKQHLKDTIQSFWPYGMCRWSKDSDGGIFVESEFAARYVTKYVVKDLDFFSQPDLEAYLYDENGNMITDRWEQFKPFRPRHWQSKSFGLGLQDYIKDDLPFRDGLDFRFVGDLRLGKRKVYKVPRYIERKLLYKDEPFYYKKYDDEGEEIDFWFVHHSQVLNDRGKSVKRDLLSFDYKLDELSKRNSDLLEFRKYNQFKVIAPDIKVDYSEHFKQLLCGKSIRYYSAWQLAFRGTVFGKDDLGIMLSLRNASEDTFINFCRNLYNMRVDGYFIDDFFSDIGFVQDKNTPKHYNLDDFSVFSCFYRLNSLLLRLKNKGSVNCYNNYRDSVLTRKKIKLLVV